MIRRLGILHLTTFLQGGAGRAIADLACAQHEAGHRVTVVTSETGVGEFGNYPEYLDRLRTAGVALHTRDSLFTRDVTANMRVVDMLSRTLDVASLDVIHAHAAVPAFIGQVFATGAPRHLPVVQTQHGWGINKTAAQASFDMEILGRVDRVIATSRATRELLIAFGIPSGSIATVPCGIAPSESAPVPDAAMRAVEPLRARGLRVLGCVGSVTANKNQSLILDALARATDVPAAVVFVGEGSETLAGVAAGLGIADRVVTCGYQPRASGWMPCFDLLVIPSRSEGQGLVALEAFRAGVPVAASAIPAFRGLIEHGRSGFLFASDDAGELVSVLREAVALAPTAREAMVRTGRARLEADFTTEKMVARHEYLYAELVGESEKVAEAG